MIKTIIPYLKITLFSIMFSSIVMFLINDASRSSSYPCPIPPGVAYTSPSAYKCVKIGFPLKYYEEDIWGHHPKYFITLLLFNLFIWFTPIFLTLIFARKFVIYYFGSISMNKFTKIATIFEFWLPIFIIFISNIATLPIREGPRGIEYFFDIGDWDLLILPISVFIGIIFGVIGLFDEHKRVKEQSLAHAEDTFISKTLRKLFLYAPFLLALVWIAMVIRFIVGWMGYAS